MAQVDSLLPSHVYSSRLGLNPPGWAFKRIAHAQMRAHALAFVKSGMLVDKLDVETYYPTLDIDILELNLVAWGWIDGLLKRSATSWRTGTRRKVHEVFQSDPKDALFLETVTSCQWISG